MNEEVETKKSEAVEMQLLILAEERVQSSKAEQCLSLVVRWK